MRRAIAAAMSRSKREIPHYYLATTIDAGPALRWLAEHNRTRPPAERILLAALLLQGVARALHQVPALNGFYVDDSFHASEHVHVGVAISLRGGGLVAPALHDGPGIIGEQHLGGILVTSRANDTVRFIQAWMAADRVMRVAGDDVDKSSTQQSQAGGFCRAAEAAQ